MPDHMHGIVALVADDSDRGMQGEGHGNHGKVAINRDPIAGLDPTARLGPTDGLDVTATQDSTARHDSILGGVTEEHNPMLKKHLGRELIWYKGRVSYKRGKIDKSFAWQSNYFDRIIKSDSAYRIVEQYILNNPRKW